VRHRRHRGPARAGKAAASEPSSSPSPSAPPEAASCDFVATSHTILFATDSELRCDACGCPLASSHEGAESPGPAADDEGFAPRGEGVYLWARGDEVRLEKAPLCGTCASAIGMTALARWEIEEEEG
jgi:hypothetical protein